MKSYIKHDPWCIIEEGFHPEHNRITESVMSIGNGRMGQRANFEEYYSGDSLQGNYIAGVYYPDKTRVGWWKNGYPEYFAKVLNAVNWIGIDVYINGVRLDLYRCTIKKFRRVLNMKEGWLERTALLVMENNLEVQLTSKRLLSIVDDESGAIRYQLTVTNADAEITIQPFLDFDVKNQDSNYDEKFWDEVCQKAGNGTGYVVAKTKKTGFVVSAIMQYQVFVGENLQNITAQAVEKEKYTGNIQKFKVKKQETLSIEKYVAICASLNHPEDKLVESSTVYVQKVMSKGFDRMLQEQIAAWDKKWEESDIAIEGDIAAQQGIRFNIFQLNQTYTGEDERLNIGPKGFTGEKYGGSTYWDTEAYCIPFYLATSDPKIAKNLLVYRYKQLHKAIENAEKLGFSGGAALYPMVTMNGEECHNEWEITFEEIHRNGAIAFAIYNYIRYTGDEPYLIDYGLEVLIAISRFWAQRVNFSQEKKKYVMLGVTGPNEYENNVNNNWYTSKMACWTLGYTCKSIEYVKNMAPRKFEHLIAKLKFDETKETAQWKTIFSHMYYPEDKEQEIFLQQDGYLDKEQILVKDLPPKDLPLNQKWSWDRILRSCFIKQADVLQGLYFLENQFDTATIKRNFDFYEPRTVHESSLSACVHSILAAKIGYEKKAYEMYLRTARLDLDDYNNDTDDGCHITSMGGTWMTVIQGFGGMRVYDDKLRFSPMIPAQWEAYSFKILFREHLLKIRVTKKEVLIENQSTTPISLFVFDKMYQIDSNSYIVVG
ncbi:MAG: glycoside hydrolase family 65 protein [Lentimicrobiaceae bacterium]|nr:glycoside hydrolase family 65 protein [Lentimicrobiaceae bacterium]